MNLAKFPRRRYTHMETPIEPLLHLSKNLGGPTIFMKRDDLLGLTSGGNKTRKLEFLVADALLNGADTLITCGAIQSNHCRLTLAAAVKEGLSCHLVLEERVPNTYDPNASGNNFLFKLLGADQISVVPKGSNMQAAMEQVKEKLKEQGRKPYIIPGGGSNEIGATGYVACAEEILNQSFQNQIQIDHVVTASGSGGTHAGLVAGFFGTNSKIPVTGVNVSRKKEEQEDLIYNLAKRVSSHVGIREELPREAVVCFDDYVGPGYSLPTDQMIEAIQLVARTEGILLDPVYSGKAMAGMIDLVRKGYFNAEDQVLFVHTGGSPALYAYTDTVLNDVVLHKS
ncbi:D-cysteine desulfhydrase [Chengkuizengella axinellae]|uniref:D-cysteine desulfhydrase n=1 Tax=Chengkuizengella axinellae TaxID=3064388 RepID=A0ABT9IVD0_9BACL|nr:D-cysteine desulfhydrase [Chengkuizengella sp. 2205SS18-9]MDP5273282.1 D-cysteine desulfhydrase [Chengkuizengella sp. 2205SS18-9]